MSQFPRVRRFPVRRGDPRPPRTPAHPGLPAQSSPPGGGRTFFASRRNARSRRLRGRGAGLLVGAVALALVGAGAYAVPRLVPPDAPAAAPALVAGPASAAAPTPAGTAPPRASTSARQATKKPRTTSRDPQHTKVPATGPGTYRTADEHAAAAGRSGRVYRFDVRVEKGLEIDPDAAARAIARTLDDPRSWRSSGRARFRLVGRGETADLHAYLVTPGTTDRLCYPLLTRGEVSCQAGNKVVLNAKRWLRGAPAYGKDVAGYREYLVNHEFGHALGLGHLTCPRSGRPAPVMLQQTKGLDGCRQNPWPATTGH